MEKKAIRDDRILVRLIKKQSPYNAGERCKVSPDVARIWVRAKVAVVIGADGTQAGSGTDQTTWDVGVKALKPVISEITDRDRLVAMAEGEKQHPEYGGGRVGVLKMIDARLEELGPGPNEQPAGEED